MSKRGTEKTVTSVSADTVFVVPVPGRTRFGRVPRGDVDYLWSEE